MTFPPIFYFTGQSTNFQTGLVFGGKVNITAKFTGSPSPDITFSRDDSSGVFGSGEAQIILTKASPNYTLTASAKNSAGQASDSITLNWVEPKTTAATTTSSS